MKKEFTYLGINIELISVYYGIFLFTWGLFVSFISESESLTSFIPSLLGLPIFILSYFSFKFPNLKKLLMHIVATIGFIIFIGGIDFLRSFVNKTLFLNFWADISKLIMLISGSFFVFLCVQSFRYARKNKN